MSSYLLRLPHTVALLKSHFKGPLNKKHKLAHRGSPVDHACQEEGSSNDLGNVNPGPRKSGRNPRNVNHRTSTTRVDVKPSIVLVAFLIRSTGKWKLTGKKGTGQRLSHAHHTFLQGEFGRCWGKFRLCIHNKKKYIYIYSSETTTTLQVIN